MSASEKAKKTKEERTISKPKIRKVESDDDDSDFECYNKSDGKPVHVDIDKEVTNEGPPVVYKAEYDAKGRGRTGSRIISHNHKYKRHHTQGIIKKIR